MALPDWLADDERIVARHHRPATDGVTTDWPVWVPEEVVNSLGAAGIERPWLHQAELANLAFEGNHAAICTSTASGKTLASLLPVMAATAVAEPRLGVHIDTPRTRLLRRAHTALYLAPTKALAHDQYRAAKSLGPAGWRVGTLDGDSDQAERRFAREFASYVLTNPDMLHRSVLPNHSRWSGLLGGLRYVIIDEAHRYRGVFGAHVANVIRRLRRICHSYGADPVFILATATSTDAAISGGKLIGENEIAVVADDASPWAQRDVLLWQPRTTPADDAAELMASLIDDGRQTLTFVASRTMAELISVRAQDRVTGTGEVAAYRSGYLAQDRREIEAGLQTRALAGVASTNALELGIDVAGMDAVILAGYPGTLAALWQQIGRAGRRGRDAIAVVMAREDPLDAYLFSHPELIFDAPVEQTILHPQNPHVMGPHLAAAAQESALTEQDARWFGPTMPLLSDALSNQGVLRKRPVSATTRNPATEAWFWTRPDRAVDMIDLRSMGGRSLDIVETETGRVIGQIDPSAADRTVHPGAIYLHQGDQWLVTELVPDEFRAMVKADRPGYWTQPQGIDDVRIIRELSSRPFGTTGAMVHTGEVELSSQVVAYLRRDEITSEVWDQTPLDLPVRSFKTRSMWWTIPASVLQSLGFDAIAIGSAAHAAEHCAIGLLPLFAPCDRWDIGGLSTVMHADTGECTIFVHDGHPGGAGFAERGYEVAEAWWTATHDRLRDCPCEDGCPACVVSPKCGNQNQMLNKQAALLLTGTLLGLTESPSSTAAS